MACRTVYFDTNVYDHIHKRQPMLGSDLTRLQLAVDRGTISIPVSPHVLEEIIAAVNGAYEVVGPELALVRRLTDRTKILADPKTMLEQDVRRYARGRRPAPPFTTDPKAQEFVHWLLDCDLRSSDLLEATEMFRRQKEAFREDMENAKRRNRKLMRDPKARSNIANFDNYWDFAALWLAKSMAEQMGLLPECTRRGGQGLLQIRSVRLRIGILALLYYVQNIEGLSPRAGDSRDALHAVCASPADTFVTDDKRFAKLLKRIPMDNFQVLNLDEFLTQIRLMCP